MATTKKAPLKWFQFGSLRSNKALGAQAQREAIMSALNARGNLGSTVKLIRDINTKPSYLRRWGYGLRGFGRGLTMAALAGATQELLGANRTQRLDTARDFYSPLPK